MHPHRMSNFLSFRSLFETREQRIVRLANAGRFDKLIEMGVGILPSLEALNTFIGDAPVFMGYSNPMESAQQKASHSDSQPLLVSSNRTEQMAI